MASKSIVAKEIEAISQHLYVIAQTLIQNRPDTTNMDIAAKVQVLNNYSSHFFSANDSILAAVSHIASISTVEPVKSIHEFLGALPEINLNEELKKSSSITYISWLDKADLADLDVRFLLKLMNEIITAMYLEELISQLQDMNVIISHQLFEFILVGALQYNDDILLSRISFVSGAFWARALYYICPYVSNDVFDAIIAFMQRSESQSVIKVVVYLRLFSKFNPKELTIEQFKLFVKSLSPLSKIIIKNNTLVNLANAFVSFLANCMGVFKTLLPQISVSDLISPIQKFVQQNLNHPERPIQCCELEAMRIAFSNEPVKKCQQFIEKQLTPLLNHRNRAESLLMSLTFLLRGPNYANSTLLTKNHQNFYWKPKPGSVPMDAIDALFEKAVMKGGYFQDAQPWLSEFVVQLAAYSLEEFVSKRMKLISSPIFVVNNKQAFTMAMTSMLLPGSPFSGDKQLMPQLIQASRIVTTKFVREANISLAPSGATVFSVMSLVSALKTSSLPLMTFLLQLPRISHPMPPDSTSPKIIPIKWDRGSESQLRTAVFEHYTPNIRPSSGYTDPFSAAQLAAKIHILNMTTFTPVDLILLQTVASFVLSSSDAIAAMAVHVLQAAVHRQASTFFTLAKLVANLVHKCPLIEAEHLFRIVYTMEQLVDSVVFLKMQIDSDDKIAPVVQVGVLGLCSSSHYVRAEAIKLLRLAAPVTGADVFIAFEADLESSSVIPSTTAQKSYCAEVISTDYVCFTDVAMSSYNSFYQFFLASYAAQFKHFDKEVMGYLLDCLNFFEIETVDFVFIQNAYTFLTNCSRPSNMSAIPPNTIFLNLWKAAQTHPEIPFGLSLFCAVDENIIQLFMRPAFEFVGSLSFEISLLVCTGADAEFLVEALDKLMALILSSPTEVSDTAIYHHLVSARIIFKRIFDGHKCVAMSQFPRDKAVLAVGAEKLFDASTWFSELPRMMNSEGLLSKLAEKCFVEVLKVVGPPDHLVDSLIANQRIAQSKLLPPLLTRTFDKYAMKFLDSSSKKPEMFAAIAGQFAHFGRIDEYVVQWKNAINGSIKDNFSEFVFSHAGELLALGLFYLTGTNREAKMCALDVIAGVALTCIVARNGTEDAAQVYKRLFNIKKCLSPALSVVLATELQHLSSALAQRMAFCNEQFLSKMLILATQSPRILHLVTPWLDTVSITTSDIISSSTEPLFRCLTPGRLISLLFAVPSGSALNRVIKTLTTNDFAFNFFVVATASHSLIDAKQARMFGQFLIGSKASETAAIFARLTSPSFQRIVGDHKSFCTMLSFIISIVSKCPVSVRNQVGESAPKILAAAAAHECEDSSSIFAAFPGCTDKTEYFEALYHWARSGSPDFSNAALSALSKSNAPIPVDLISSQIARASSELCKIERPVRENTSHLIASISRALNMISTENITYQFFWGAVRALQCRGFDSEPIVNSALKLIDRALGSNHFDPFPAPEGFAGIFPLMLDGVLTSKSKRLWFSVIEKALRRSIDLVATPESCFIDLMELENFPVRSDCGTPGSVQTVVDNLSRDNAQKVIEFLAKLEPITRKNGDVPDRERIFMMLAELVDANKPDLDLSCLSKAAYLAISENIVRQTKGKVTFLCALTKAKFKISNQPTEQISPFYPSNKFFVEPLPPEDDCDKDLEQLWILSKEIEPKVVPQEQTIAIPQITPEALDDLLSASA